jgi:hypothetical protein
MTTWFVRSVAAAGLTLVALMPQAASAFEYPYCLQGSRWGYPGNCQFQTYEQCQATASGTIDYCDVNPSAAGNPSAAFAPPLLEQGHRPFRHHHRR